MIRFLAPDTGNYHKLRASLGVGLIVAALGLPWLVFQNTAVLTIKRSELGQYTPRARDILDHRQRTVGVLDQGVWFASAALAIGGGVLLVLGAKGLRDSQQLEDREAALRVEQAEANIRAQTPAEQAASLTADVEDDGRQVREAEPDAPDVETATPDEVPTPDAEGNGSRTSTRARDGGTAMLRGDRRVVKAARVERQVLDQLADADIPRGYVFRPLVAVETAAGQGLLLDGVFLASVRKFPDIVVEIKLARYANRGGGLVDAVVSATAKYQATTGRPARGWMIVVVPSEIGDDDRKEMSRRLNADARHLARVTVLAEDELWRLPDKARIAVKRLSVGSE